MNSLLKPESVLVLKVNNPTIYNAPLCGRFLRSMAQTGYMSFALLATFKKKGDLYCESKILTK